MASVSSFRDLEVWQESMDIVVVIYEILKGHPKTEMYGLTDQMKRAAVSIPSNIAEGWGRTYTQEYLKHLAIASGSLAELATQLEISRRLGFIDEERWTFARAQLEQLGRKLNALRQSLTRHQQARKQAP